MHPPVGEDEDATGRCAPTTGSAHGADAGDASRELEEDDDAVTARSSSDGSREISFEAAVRKR